MIIEKNFNVLLKSKENGYSSTDYHYLQTSNEPYMFVKKDFEYLPLFHEIDALKIEQEEKQMLFVSGNDIDTVLLAANYVAKKWTADIPRLQNRYKAKLYLDHYEKEDDEPYELTLDDIEMQLFGQKQDSDMEYELFNSNDDVIELQLGELPIVEEEKFLAKYIKETFDPYDGKPRVQLDDEVLYETPKTAWYEKSEIVIVLVKEFHTAKWLTVLPYLKQHIIFVKVGQQQTNLIEKMRYVREIKHLDVGKVPTVYLKQLLQELLEQDNVELSEQFHMESFLFLMKKQKKSKLFFIRDTKFMAQRLARYAKNYQQPVTNELAERMLQTNSQQSFKKIQQLVGLQEVKLAIQKIAKKMLFNSLRAENNEPVLDQNNVLLFVGNPGTAKTTVAKLMGEYFVDQGLLESSVFKVVTRKDLIGEYVGHTAPKVQALFQEVKGGVLFIDEAYSLYEENASRSFANEAMAELVQCIEENPDTLVIFAGYPVEMEQFVEQSNAGLKSRITHIVHFEDYSFEEMCAIYKSFVNKAELQLDENYQHFTQIQRFLSQVRPEQLQKEGNGRLMRKIAQRTIEEMIMEQNYCGIIKKEHLEAALLLISREFSFIGSKKKISIGFK